MENNSAFDSFEMQVSNSAQSFLKTAANWAMFLSVIGFICLGFGLLMSFGIMAAGQALDEIPGFMGVISAISLGIIMLAFTVLFFLPVLYLFKFSISTKKAIDQNSTEGITKAFSNLKSYFMWSGILTIIWILSYIGFIIVFATAAAAMRNV
ncbi:DUF5362 family protein [Flavobacterium hauense]